MARRSSRPIRDRLSNRPTTKRVLAFTGLGVFALADVALIAMALGVIDLGGASDADSSDARPVAPIAQAPTQTAEPSAPATEQPLATAVQRSLAVVDQQVAWRAERGDCATQAVIEVTTDGGATWTATEPQTAEGREVLWLWAQDESYAQAVVTAGDACEIAGIRTFTSGDFWQSNDAPLESAAYVHPEAGLVTPEEHTAPCESPVDVHSGSATAVLCADGTVHHSEDGGASWSQATVPGAVAISDAAEGFAVAAQGVASCEGIALVYLTVPDLIAGAAPTQPRTCLTGAIDPATSVVDTSGEAVWLWSGDEVGIVPLETLVA